MKDKEKEPVEIYNIFTDEREPVEKIREGVRKAIRILALCLLCFWTMKAGEKDSSSQEILTPDVSQEETGQRSLKIQVIDELPQKSDKEAVVCNMHDAFSEKIYLEGLYCGTELEDVETMHLNTAWFSVPDKGTLCFGVPTFSTEILTEGEQEQKEAWHYVEGEDCEAFNLGMEESRKLIANGFLNNALEAFLNCYPELSPYEREYTLQIVKAETTLREEDRTAWWDLDYVLLTEAENGEIVMLAYIDITKVTQVDGEAWDYDDAHYRIDAAEENIWRLLEDPAADKGTVWIQQIVGDEFADEESIRSYVKQSGAAILLPACKNREISWKWEGIRQTGFWYDYLVWQGVSDTYELTLAIPLMEKNDEGWYMASRIRKEAVDKEECEYVLSGMMQTFRGVPYIHIVKEGESLSKIAEQYMSLGQSAYTKLRLYDGMEGVPFENPDLIYPGQKVLLPESETGKTWKREAEAGRVHS